jgi:KRAB domain-containing zinc finger protein
MGGQICFRELMTIAQSEPLTGNLISADTQWWTPLCSLFQSSSNLRIEARAVSDGLSISDDAMDGSQFPTITNAKVGGETSDPEDTKPVRKYSSAFLMCPHKCQLCDEVFTTSHLLYQHHLEHGLPSTCKSCGEVFLSLISFQKHQHISWCSIFDDLKCECCGLVFGSVEQYSNHKKLKQMGRCEKCGRFYKDLLAHQKFQVDCYKILFKCPKCPRSFSYELNLINHLRFHDSEKNLCCDKCGRKFVLERGLAGHKCMGLGRKPFKCDQCDAAYTRKSHLQRHELTHSRERPYQCKECKKTFSKKSHLFRHKFTHSGKQPYKCEHCEEAFNDKGNYTGHIRKYHQQTPSV